MFAAVVCIPDMARFSDVTELPSYEELKEAVITSISAIQHLAKEKNNAESRLSNKNLELELLREHNLALKQQIMLVGANYLLFAESYSKTLLNFEASELSATA